MHVIRQHAEPVLWNGVATCLTLAGHLWLETWWSAGGGPGGWQVVDQVDP